MSNYIGYDQNDNARRKANNTGDAIDGIGKNQNVKAYSSKPGQLSMKDQASLEQTKLNRLNKSQPVRSLKDFSEQELVDLAIKYGHFQKGA
jgi:hypothetical protein